MQPSSSRVAESVTPLFISFITIIVLSLWASEAWAFETYSDCKDCHGSFRDSPYVSLSDGASWGDNLHNVHRNDMLGGDCDACHTSSGRGTVFLDRSSGGNGLATIGCVGCHGREEDLGNDGISAGRGAGLRQHHTNAGETNCQACHSDAVPANYTPVGEDVLPNYFASPGTNHPSMPTDSCNPTGTENFAAGTQGLDNDGDGSYDTVDSDCIVIVTHTVGGNVSGLTGSGLSLQNNGTDTLAVAANGPFTFATELEEGSAYAVTISAQPVGQTCNVSSGSGTIATANITNVVVNCVTDVIPTHSVGGNVSGLTGSGLALQNNGTDTLAVAANGPFTFATELEEGSAYAVTISAQPIGQTCNVSSGSGTIATASITNVTVTCTTSFQINAGLNDAWYYPVTDGQGFFITISPAMGRAVVSWFTYDTERPAQGVSANLGEPGHRWFNASGLYNGNQAVLNIKMASGGIFDTPTEITRVEDGTMILTFYDCNTGSVEYDIPSINQSGLVPIQRVAGDNIALCESITEQMAVQQADVGKIKNGDHILSSSGPIPEVEAPLLVDLNPGLNDAWYYPETDGQGFFITVFPDLRKVVASWFTYDTVRPAEGVTANLGEPGHRWFNASGRYEGNQAIMTNKIASGGIFDTPTEIDRVRDGTMTITFENCNSGTVEYNIPSIGQSGIVPIQRIAADNVALCESYITQ